MVSFVAHLFASIRRAPGNTDSSTAPAMAPDAILGAMRRSLWSRRAPAALLGAALVTASAVVMASPAQFTSYSRSSRNILEGNWQSCREADGRYSERVYDHVVNGVPRFEVHMGPRREFAIFAGVQEEHREHDSPANLLQPYRLNGDGNLAQHEWKIPSLNLVFTATLAGGSRGDCESWYLLLAPLNKPSH
jgi:hypothetical protein